ncbi:MAG: nicotinate-nucleotide--dimethylbenzimidazole phosphoribosyltransferase [Eubacteriales bacterium]
MTLNELIMQIKPTDETIKTAAKCYWDCIAKPLRGMGLMEDYITKINGVLGEIEQFKKCVAVMCADNGIVEENVTQTGSDVTAIVARNIMDGQATVANMAKIANADVFAYDLGMLSDVDNTINRKIAYGTKNFIKDSAMSREEAEKAIMTGTEIARELKEKGYNMIASGEMGIGNTTTSSAIIAVLFNVPAAGVTGRGAGLSKEGICHKADIINLAIDLHKPDRNDPIDILSKIGGFDIAAMCGLFLGGAYYGIPVIIDGFISSVAALLAVRLCPDSADYMLASHLSAEPASKMVMNELGFTAPLCCGMALGEGTGAVSLMPLLDMALAVYKNMPTFAQTHIEEYKPL